MIDGVAHVALGGELDIATLTLLDAALRRAWASSDVVVVDLRELEFIDSSGTRLIVDADRRIRRSGGRLIVVRGPWEVDWLFVLLGIDRELELVDSPLSLSRRQAAQALNPGASRLQPRLEFRDADHRRASA
jgi:anti-anti-sigma factor